MADYLLQESSGTVDRLLQEDGSLLLLEDGTSDILLETSGGAGGKFALEDGTGFVILETGGVTPTPEQPGGGIIIPRRRLVTRLRQEGLEEDEAIALSLLLRTRKRLR